MSLDARAPIDPVRRSPATTPWAHVVQVYERDEELAVMVAQHVAEGLRVGERAVVVATAAHRASFQGSLAGEGVDVAFMKATGLYVELDAAETLARFMVDDSPDPRLFDAVIGGLVRDLVADGRPLRAYGEMVALLWEAGNVNAAIALEALWNELGAQEPFALYCAYPADAFGDVDDLARFQAVCRHHTDLIGPPEPDVAIERSSAWRMFAPTADAPRAARRFALAAFDQLGRPSDAGMTALVVSELAANAVRHARTSFSVTVSWRDGISRIEVHDLSSETPTRRDVPAESTSGRGIHLVASSSIAYGWHGVADGKVVWAELSS